MRLVVTTEGGVYKLTAAIVACAIIVCLFIAHIFLRFAIPADFPESREFLTKMGYFLSLLGSISVGTPFALMVSKSLLKAHQLQQNIIAMAQTDHLTGLPNRVAVLKNIEQAVADSVVAGSEGTVLFVDLDHFKRINDTYGHAGGDAALRHAADIMRRTIGPDAILGRFGGEEFVCFIEDAERAPAIAAAIIVALRESSAAYGGLQIPVKASIGLANTDGMLKTTHLLSRADEALYIAKYSGRDCIVSYDEVMLHRLGAKLTGTSLQRRSSDRAEPLAA